MPTFTPPTRRVPVQNKGLRYAYYEGITVLKTAGAYTQVQAPTQDDINAADIAYLGGHSYAVDSTEAAALTAAGYGAYIS